MPKEEKTAGRISSISKNAIFLDLSEFEGKEGGISKKEQMRRERLKPYNNLIKSEI
ncbi:hypothetical protein [Atopococcus tabaci]|uniref:hypothetical protein n=1 Tax=Atopococcus tabaci TaxID=269774 RepID=UPI00240A24B8|nr:hypothetical protein [Atopococcus tabaci]